MSMFTLTQRSTPHRAYQIIGWAIGIGIIIYLPYQSNQAVRIEQYAQVAAIAVAILGLNLVVGYSGAISLGHSVFVGIGAYTTMILVADHDWSYFATMPAAFAICFVVGVVVGLPALRIGGFYLAMITLGLATIFPAVVLKYGTLTGGTTGKMAHDKLLPPDWTPWDVRDRAGQPTYRYFVIVAIAALMFLLARNLLRSRVGRALIAQRDNQTSAATSGVNVAVYKTLIFGTSAAFAGIAGSLLMIQRPQATETQFGVTLAIYLFVGLVLGGVATISGAIPGAILFVFVPYYTARWSTNFSFLEGRLVAPADLLYGVLLLAVVFVLPGGAMDGIRRVRMRIVRVLPNPSWLSSVTWVGKAVAAETERVADEDHDEAPTTPNTRH
jgi:branched-chain amino acid transport system permease protein